MLQRRKAIVWDKEFVSEVCRVTIQVLGTEDMPGQGRSHCRAMWGSGEEVERNLGEDAGRSHIARIR